MALLTGYTSNHSLESAYPLEGVLDTSDKVLNKYDFIKIEGSQNGTAYQAIKFNASTLQRFIGRLTFEGLEVMVYTGHIEIVTKDHDGMDCHTLTPFDISALTKAQMIKLINKCCEKGLFSESCGKSLSKASKCELIDFIVDNDLLEDL